MDSPATLAVSRERVRLGTAYEYLDAKTIVESMIDPNEQDRGDKVRALTSLLILALRHRPIAPMASLTREVDEILFPDGFIYRFSPN